MAGQITRYYKIRSIINEQNQAFIKISRTKKVDNFEQTLTNFFVQTVQERDYLNNALAYVLDLVYLPA